MVPLLRDPEIPVISVQWKSIELSIDLYQQQRMALGYFSLGLIHTHTLIHNTFFFNARDSQREMTYNNPKAVVAYHSLPLHSPLKDNSVSMNRDVHSLY